MPTNPPLVLAVDFSPASRLALDACALLAPRLRAPVVLLHAGGGGKDPGWEEARREGRAWARALAKAGVAAEVVVRPGPPADAILDEAERRGAAMVVMGTSGATGLRGFVLGSVARDVLGRSRRPVLLAPLRMRTARNGSGGRAVGRVGGPVVAGVDFSPHAEAAVRAAARMAKALRRPLRLVHVVDVYPYASGASAGAGIPAGLIEKDEADAAARLRPLVRQAERQGVRATAAVQLGQPASALLADAAAAAASLVVVGTHGRSGLRRILLGSVAQHVVHAADRPVLVVPAPQA